MWDRARPFSKLTPSKIWSKLKLHGIYNCHTLVSVNSTFLKRCNLRCWRQIVVAFLKCVVKTVGRNSPHLHRSKSVNFDHSSFLSQLIHGGPVSVRYVLFIWRQPDSNVSVKTVVVLCFLRYGVFLWKSCSPLSNVSVGSRFVVLIILLVYLQRSGYFHAVEKHEISVHFWCYVS